MGMIAIAFAVGIGLCQLQPALPLSPWPPLMLSFAATAAVLMLFAPRFGTAPVRRLVAVCLAFAIGFCWSALRAEWRLGESLPMQWEQRDIAVRGVVASLPQVYDSGMVRFRFLVEEAEAPVPRRIQLSWYAQGWGGERFDVPALRPGERWGLVVRLRRPHGLFNPHGFDQEARWLEEGVRAVGYVRAQAPSERLDTFVLRADSLMHRARDHVRHRFGQGLGEATYAGILIALAVGDQRAIPEAQWEVFRNTAVAHLVSISGLHVSLVAVFGGGLVALLWWCVPRLAERLPRRRAMAAGGLLCAAAYAVLAGLGLPVQRALLMLAVACLALMLGRETRPGSVLALALIVVLAVDPWAVMSAGFWLSFGAVSIIMAVVAGRFPPPGKLAGAVRIQLAITLALSPLLLALFGAFSLVSPLANAFAIPVVSFFVTPLVLVAMVLPWSAPLDIAHWAAAWMMAGLERLAALPIAMWHGPAVPSGLIILALAGCAWLLMPSGTKGKSAAVLALVPMLLWTPARPPSGSAWLTVFDVGQGLAVHVQTASHDLLYDAGPPYGPVSDAGRRVILPFLQAEGVRRLDRMIVSHAHNDHLGGAASILRAIEVGDVTADVDARHALRREAGGRIAPCAAGARWEWDGVRFEVLYPVASAARLPFNALNDDSCVVRVEAGGHAVLLTGDIEAGAERHLVRAVAERLQSDVVVVPHHGSRTSSSPAFARATGARHAIHSAGMLNPFRHPHPLVWARWDALGARNWRTDSQGAIRIRLDAHGVEVVSERERRRRYWHGR